MSVRNNDRVMKKRAVETLDRFVLTSRNRLRRIRLYRKCLIIALVLSCIVLSGSCFFYLESAIPSVIHMRPGHMETLKLKLPARGSIVSAGRQPESNIPENNIVIDLSRTVRMKVPQEYDGEMQVKLFGFLPIKKVDLKVIEACELIPIGKPVGIYVKADGILVIGTGEFQGEDGITYSPAKDILGSGDYIKKVNGKEIQKKGELEEAIHRSLGEIVTLTIKRADEELNLKVRPKKDITGDYKIGVWVRDSTQGIGTMTFIDENGNFGALGHGISDVDTNTLMCMDKGLLYETRIININKGAIGKPGELTGVIVYDKSRQLAQITKNSTQGIFGKCYSRAYQMEEEDAMPIGLKQDIRKGEAQILCTVNEKTDYYKINIIDIHLDSDNKNRGLVIEVVDSRLLELTGGIVQGMSGSPIIQDGKIIGAVTHVLVNDPTRGYGIFIEEMLGEN